MSKFAVIQWFITAIFLAAMKQLYHNDYSLKTAESILFTHRQIATAYIGATIGAALTAVGLSSLLMVSHVPVV